MCRLTGVKCRYTATILLFGSVQDDFCSGPFRINALDVLSPSGKLLAKIQGCAPKFGSIQMISSAYM